LFPKITFVFNPSLEHMITAIYVDDDPNAIEDLVQIAKTIPNFWLKATFNDAAAAIEWLRLEKIDIVFTDIEMPERDGLWLADQLKTKYDIVFLTSYTEYAYNAFEACALDYLLKPINPARLRDVISRFKNGYGRRVLIDQLSELIDNYSRPTSYPHRIFVNVTGHLRVVDLNDVLYFAASGSYCNVHFRTGEVLLASKPMKTYTAALEQHPDYIRIHRSFVVNKKHITKLNREPNRFSITLSNGDMLEVSPKKKDEIFAQLTK